MKIKLEKLLFAILCLIILIGILSCEKNIHKGYYIYFQCITVILSLLFLLFFLRLNKDKKELLSFNLNKNKYIILLFLLMNINSVINGIYNSDVSGFLYTIMFSIMMIIFAFAVPVYLNYYKKYTKKFLNYLSIMSLILSLIGIYIYHFGSILNYSLVYGRAASIIFDPNFFATIIAAGAICSFSSKKKMFILITMIINIYAIIISGSRGALLSLAITLFIYWLTKYKTSKLKKIILSILLVVLALYALNWLESSGFFRAYQGSNGRLEMILYFINIIISRPLTGYGYNSADNLLKLNNMSNASSHNSIIDFMVGYGLPCMILLGITLFYSLIKGYKKNNYTLFLINLLLIINSNTILYNIGGVNICSLLFTIFLGMNTYEANKEVSKNEKSKI